MATHSFKDLVVWQEAMGLVRTVYGVCRKLPKEEIYALSDQMRRSAVSVPSDIAEGQKRINRQEFIQFLGIALGSLGELETQLILASDLYDIQTMAEQEKCSKVTAMVVRLMQTLRTQNSEPRTRTEGAK